MNIAGPVVGLGIQPFLLFTPVRIIIVIHNSKADQSAVEDIFVEIRFGHFNQFFIGLVSERLVNLHILFILTEG